MDTNGGHLRRLTDDRREILGMTWNREGTGLILAASGQDGLHRLVERNIVSGQTTQLYDRGIFTAFPDGRQIAFNSYRAVSRTYLLADGKQDEVLNDGSFNSRLSYLRTGSTCPI